MSSHTDLGHHLGVRSSRQALTDALASCGGVRACIQTGRGFPQTCLWSSTKALHEIPLPLSEQDANKIIKSNMSRRHRGSRRVSVLSNLVCFLSNDEIHRIVQEIAEEHWAHLQLPKPSRIRAKFARLVISQPGPVIKGAIDDGLNDREKECIGTLAVTLPGTAEGDAQDFIDISPTATVKHLNPDIPFDPAQHIQIMTWHRTLDGCLSRKVESGLRVTLEFDLLLEESEEDYSSLRGPDHELCPWSLESAELEIQQKLGDAFRQWMRDSNNKFAIYPLEAWATGPKAGVLSDRDSEAFQSLRVQAMMRATMEGGCLLFQGIAEDMVRTDPDPAAASPGTQDQGLNVGIWLNADYVDKITDALDTADLTWTTVQWENVLPRVMDPAESGPPKKYHFGTRCGRRVLVLVKPSALVDLVGDERFTTFESLGNANIENFLGPTMFMKLMKLTTKPKGKAAPADPDAGHGRKRQAPERGNPSGSQASGSKRFKMTKTSEGQDAIDLTED